VRGRTWELLNCLHSFLLYAPALHSLQLHSPEIALAPRACRDILPVTVMERLIVIGMMVCGTVVYSLIFASLAALLSSLNTTEAAYSEFVSQVEGYMRSHRFPQPLQERILRFYEVKFEWQRSVHGEGFELLDNLPMLLQTQVAAATHAGCFEKNPLLRGVPISFAQLLAIKLKQQISVPGEVLFSAGEPATHLYIVSRGEVALVVKARPRRCPEFGDGGAVHPADSGAWQNGAAAAAAASFAPYRDAGGATALTGAAGGASTGLMAWRGSPASSVPAIHAGVEMVSLARRPSKLHREGSGGTALADQPSQAPHRSQSAGSNLTGVAASTPSHTLPSAPARRWAMVREAVHAAGVIARLRGIPVQQVLKAAFVEEHHHTGVPEGDRHRHAGTGGTEGAVSERRIEADQPYTEAVSASATDASGAVVTSSSGRDASRHPSSGSQLAAAGVSTSSMPVPAAGALADNAIARGSGTASPASCVSAAATAATVGRLSSITFSGGSVTDGAPLPPREISHGTSLSGGSQGDGLGGHAGRVLRRMHAALRLQGHGAAATAASTIAESPAVQATIGSVAGKKPNKKDQKQRQKLLALYSQAAKERGGEASHAEPRVESVLRAANVPHTHGTHGSGGTITTTLSGASGSLASRTPVVDSPITPRKAGSVPPPPGSPLARDASIGAFGTRSMNAHATTLWQRALHRSHSQGSVPGTTRATSAGSTALQAAATGATVESSPIPASLPVRADVPTAQSHRAPVPAAPAAPASAVASASQPAPASASVALTALHSAHSPPSSRQLVRSGSGRRAASTFATSAVGLTGSTELVASQVATSSKAMGQLSNAQLAALLARGPSSSPHAAKGSGLASPGSERAGRARGRTWRSRSRSVLESVGSPLRNRGAGLTGQALPSRETAAEAPLRISAPRSGLGAASVCDEAAAAATAVQRAATSDGLRDRRASTAASAKQAACGLTDAEAVDITISPPTGWAGAGGADAAGELGEGAPLDTEGRLLQIADARHASMAREGRHIRTKRQVREHLAAVAALASTMEADEEILSWRRDGSYFGDEALFALSGDGGGAAECSGVGAAAPGGEGDGPLSDLHKSPVTGISRRPTLAAPRPTSNLRSPSGLIEHPHPVLLVEEEEAPEDSPEPLHAVAAHSTTFCELFLLEAAEWRHLMELFPTQEALFHLLAAARYKRALASQAYDDTELSEAVMASAANMRAKSANS